MQVLAEAEISKSCWRADENIVHLWVPTLVQGNNLHLSEAHPALQSSVTWKRCGAQFVSSLFAATLLKCKPKKRQPTLNSPVTAKWISKCCFSQGCCRAHYRIPPCTHTHFCYLSQTEGWRNWSREKCGRWLLWLCIMTSRQTHGDCCHSHQPPQCLCYTATAPSTSREAWDFKSTQRLCPSPQFVCTIRAAHPRSKNQIWAQVRRQKKLSLMQCTAVKIHIPQIILLILEELPLSWNSG